MSQRQYKNMVKGIVTVFSSYFGLGMGSNDIVHVTPIKILQVEKQILVPASSKEVESEGQY